MASVTMTYRELLSLVQDHPMDDARLDSPVFVAAVDDLGRVRIGRLAGLVTAPSHDSRTSDVITSADRVKSSTEDTVEDLAPYWTELAVGAGPGFEIGESTQIFNLRDTFGENPWVDAGDETKQMRPPSSQARRASSVR